MYIGIYDSKTVTNVSLRENKSILIRILEPINYNKLPIINCSSYQDILELYIKDYDKIITNQELTSTFTQLNQFILDNDFDEVIVHCSLGISRSPAIMICIAKIMNNPKLEELIAKQYQYYNKFIVQKFKKYPYIIKEVYDKEIILEYSNHLTSNDNYTLDKEHSLRLIKKRN